MECAELLATGTVTVDVPTTVCALTRYRAVFGTVTAIGPTSVTALSEAGAAAKPALIPPASVLNEATADRRPDALIRPASACALTRPARESRVTEPARVVTDTVMSRGTCTW
jgi:hypothetical protein